METVTLTIDGRQVTVEKGKTVLQAAIESGISVPYYCYHPGIGIDGSCRVCIVKIEKMPKLQTSCSTVCTEGMVVSTRTPGGRRRRAPACSSSCSSTTRSTARSATRAASARCRISRTVRPRPEPDGLSAARVRRRRRQGRRRLRPDADAEPQPLHPVHALRAVHARRRRRRADQHHRPRLRQRDRDVPGRGRALAALGQPDGRLPGRRDHDARLPVQVAAVGQPVRRRHHLHAVREGLQHHRVDQGEAGVGEGIAADPLHAALQPRRQRLLDVRHRPLRVPLDRRRRSPAASRWRGRRRRCSSRCRGTTRSRSCRDRLAAARGHGEPGRRALPALRARVARGAVPVQAAHRGAARRRRPEGDHRQLALPREAAAGATRSSRCRRSTRRTSTARGCSASRRARPATRRAKRTSRRCAQAVEAGRVAALYVFDPGPDGSLGDTTVDRRRARRAARCRC